MVAGATGECREFQEVPNRTGDPDRVSWVLIGHKTDGGETTSGESVGYQTTVPGVTPSETDLSENVSQVDSCGPSNPAKSITLQATADAKSKGFVHWQSELWVISDSDAGMQSGMGLVGKVHRPVERPNNDRAQSGSGCVDHNRCIQEGTGSCVAGSDNAGCMVRGRTGTTYQCVGTEECILCPEGFHQADDWCACASAGRQYVYSVSDKQDGGTQVRSVTGGYSAVVGLLSVEEDHAYSRTLARTFEAGGGHADSNIYEDSSNWWLMPKVFKQLEKLWGPILVDWFADRLNAQVRKFVSWKPDPEAWQVDVFTVPWTKELGYAFPPFCLIARCLAKVQKDRAEMVLVTRV